MIRKIEKPEDIGTLITEDYMKKMKIIEVILALIFILSFVVFSFYANHYDKQDYPSPREFINAIMFLTLTLTSMCISIYFFITVGSGDTSDYSDMPTHKCRKVLEVLDTYPELFFLKERIANLDRKLVNIEGDYLINYRTNVVENREAEASCKRLYGI